MIIILVYEMKMIECYHIIRSFYLLLNDFNYNSIRFELSSVYNNKYKFQKYQNQS